MIFGGYKTMWVYVMFDLPTVTSLEKKRASSFRRELLKDGFIMDQYSIYKRHCAGLDNAKVHIKRVESMVPADGIVHVLTITDKQYGNMECFINNSVVEPDLTPEQLSFF